MSTEIPFFYRILSTEFVTIWLLEIELIYQESRMTKDIFVFNTVDFCGHSPCKNSGNCNVGASGYTCNCLVSNFGDDCEGTRPCYNQTMNNCPQIPIQSICKDDIDTMTLTCSCPPGYGENGLQGSALVCTGMFEFLTSSFLLFSFSILSVLLYQRQSY